MTCWGHLATGRLCPRASSPRAPPTSLASRSHSVPASHHDSSSNGLGIGGAGPASSSSHLYLWESSHRPLRNTPRPCHCPTQETEAQRARDTCPRPHAPKVREQKELLSLACDQEAWGPLGPWEEGDLRALSPGAALAPPPGVSGTPGCSAFLIRLLSLQGLDSPPQPSCQGSSLKGPEAPDRACALSGPLSPGYSQGRGSWLPPWSLAANGSGLRGSSELYTRSCHRPSQVTWAGGLGKWSLDHSPPLQPVRAKSCYSPHTYCVLCARGSLFPYPPQRFLPGVQ